MASALVSVVMSVYNGERYLREAIDSILNQTFESFEFIIIDDGSSDSSAKIINSYNDPRICFVRQQNMGLAAALNKGIELSRAKYIARMDADDISHPNRLAIQYAYMETHPDVDISGGHAYLIDEKGRQLGEKRKPTIPKVISRSIEYACPLIHPTYIVKSSVYLELNGYRPEFLAGQDYDFLLRAHDAGKSLANIDEFLLYYRINEEQPRPARDRYQMSVTRIALQLHKQRVKYGSEDKDTLAKIKGYPVIVSSRFSLANKCRTFLLLQAQRKGGLLSHIMMLFVVLVSLLDFELFHSSWRGFFYRRLVRES